MARSLDYVLIAKVSSGMMNLNLNKIIDHLSQLLSTTAECPPALPAVENNEAIGSWKLSACCPSVICGSGIQALRDKKGTGIFALNYNWLLEQIKKHPKQKVYSIKGLSPVTLSKAVIQNRLEDLGKLEEIERATDVEYEVKRVYRVSPKNGKELLSNQYNSLPWDTSIVSDSINTINSIEDTEGVTA